MNSNKCRGCGLVNTMADAFCRRCGDPLVKRRPSGPISPRDAARRSFLYPLLALTVVGASIYWILSGAEKEISKIQNTPGAAKPAVSRKETEKAQTQAYKTAVQKSNGLSQSQKHVNEVERLTSTSQPKPQ
jgi:hypothetical protein